MSYKTPEENADKWFKQQEKRTKDPYRQYSNIKKQAKKYYLESLPAGVSATSPRGEAVFEDYQKSMQQVRKNFTSSGKLIDFDIIK